MATKKQNNEEIPMFAVKGSRPPWNALFSQLRDRWLAEDDERTSRELADILGAGEAHVSGWASSRASRRTPPLWAILRLASLCGLGIALYPDRVAIVQDPKA